MRVTAVSADGRTTVSVVRVDMRGVLEALDMFEVLGLSIVPSTVPVQPTRPNGHFTHT